MHPIAGVFLVLALMALAFTTIILRHKRKMALIERGINPEEPNLLKTYRRGLVLICVAVGCILLALGNPHDPKAAGFFAGVGVLLLCVGVAYLLFYRAAKKMSQSDPPPAAEPPQPATELPPKIL